MNWFKKLFAPKFTKFKYVEDIVRKEEIMVNAYENLMSNDPDEIESVPTGKYRDITYELWERKNLKTGLPNRKLIKK